MRSNEKEISHSETDWRSCCSFCARGSEMKKVLAVLLIAVAIAYYFGYDVTDFIPSLPGNNAPQPRARRAPAAAPAEQTQNAAPAPAPARSSGGTTAITNSSEGSMASRWQQSSGNSYDGSMVGRWCPYGSGSTMADRWQSYPSPSPQKP